MVIRRGIKSSWKLKNWACGIDYIINRNVFYCHIRRPWGTKTHKLVEARHQISLIVSPTRNNV